MLSPFPSYCIPHINPSKKYYLHFADGDWGSERLGNEFKVTQLVIPGALKILVI